MKLNWGHKLVGFTVLFMLFIISCVWYMLRQDVQLVESDYYEKGIKYQEVIDANASTSKLVSMHLDSAGSLQVILLDSTLNALNGELKFYRPSDKSKDFSAPVSCVFERPLLFPVSSLDKGPWKVTLLWENKHVKHALSQDISIP